MSIAENKYIRGRILRLLQISYPYPVSEKVIYQSFLDIKLPVGETSLAGHCAYLREKGYIESQPLEDRGLGIKMWVHKLAALGIDLQEGNTPADPGIEIQN
ncbi:MAG: hypothetical protein A2Y38_01620 [Spirochaetes bacterium GWB1_59_5]|nr:MAG: hypothetical protein A2Y38_01620 [Spirochaetes bacterium GWB1_59_5]